MQVWKIFFHEKIEPSYIQVKLNKIPCFYHKQEIFIHISFPCPTIHSEQLIHQHLFQYVQKFCSVAPYSIFDVPKLMVIVLYLATEHITHYIEQVFQEDFSVIKTLRLIQCVNQLD